MTERSSPSESTTRHPAGRVDIDIRSVHPDDAAQIYALRMCPGVVRQNPTPAHSTLEQTREWIVKLESPAIAIAACIDGTVVGTADLHPGSLRRAHSGRIGISVHDDWQGKGIGTRLMTELIDTADNWYGLRRLELSVFADNHRAIGLYRKFGFAGEATYRGAVLRDGLLIDTLFMGRVRAPAAHPQSDARLHEGACA